MKKLLSLLSVLTISGTAIPTTIAASPYQKEESKILNKLETLKINNLREIMELYLSNKNINKRQTQNPNKRNIHDFITVFDLGDLKDNYEDTILHAIERLNPRIRMNEIRIA